MLIVVRLFFGTLTLTRIEKIYNKILNSDSQRRMQTMSLELKNNKDKMSDIFHFFQRKLDDKRGLINMHTINITINNGHEMVFSFHYQSPDGTLLAN